MKRILLIGLFVFVSTFGAKSQTVIMYTDSFTNNVPTTTAQRTNFTNFRALLLSTYSYCSMTIKGTFDTVGQTCTDPAIVLAYANALRTNTTYLSPLTGGNTWHMCATHSQGEIWLNPPSSCNGSNCPNPGYIIRPLITNRNWGGVATATCNAPTQRMTLIFRIGNAVANAPADTIICDGQSLTLNGSGNCATYNWSNGVNDGVPFNVDSTRWYYLTGIDSAQCYAYDSVLVTVNPLPNVSVAIGTDTVCVQSGPIPVTGNPSGGTFSGTGVTGGQFAPNTAGTGDHMVFYTYTDTNGCANTDTAFINVDPCVGIEELSTYSWSVSPNPFDNVINVNSLEKGVDGDETFVVLNALGAVIRQERLTANVNSIDLRELSPGVYIYQIKGSSGKVRDFGKLIKK